MVTGENKKQFEKWFVKDFAKIEGLSDKGFKNFYDSRLEYQIGVYLAWYDSLDFNIYYHCDDTVLYCWGDRGLEYLEMENGGIQFNSRNEAYKEAFKKADELITNKKKRNGK